MGKVLTLALTSPLWRILIKSFFFLVENVMCCSPLCTLLEVCESAVFIVPFRWFVTMQITQ